MCQCTVTTQAMAKRVREFDIPIAKKEDSHSSSICSKNVEEITNLAATYLMVQRFVF